MEGIVQGHERRSSWPHDGARPVEQVVAIMHGRDRRDRSACASSVLGGSVAAAEEASAFGSKTVLACPVLRVGGPPGSVVRGAGHLQAPPRAMAVKRTDALWAPLLEPGNANSSLPGRRETIATSDGLPRPGRRPAGATNRAVGRRRGRRRRRGGEPTIRIGQAPGSDALAFERRRRGSTVRGAGGTGPPGLAHGARDATRPSETVAGHGERAGEPSDRTISPLAHRCRIGASSRPNDG